MARRTYHLVELAVIALPLLRPLRALRLLRVVNIFRAGLILTNALRRLRGVLTHHGLHYVLFVVLGVVVVCAALEFEFEDGTHGANIQNFGDALWWAIVAVTTVGYGDKFPVSAGGRGVAVVLMLVGIGLIGILTATVASFFIGQGADEEKAALQQRLDRIEGMLGKSSLDGSNRTMVNRPRNYPAQIGCWKDAALSGRRRKIRCHPGSELTAPRHTCSCQARSAGARCPCRASRADSSDTAGLVTVCEGTLAPWKPGPPLHLHTSSINRSRVKDQPNPSCQGSAGSIHHIGWGERIRTSDG